MERKLLRWRKVKISYLQISFFSLGFMGQAACSFPEVSFTSADVADAAGQGSKEQSATAEAAVEPAETGSQLSDVAIGSAEAQNTTPPVASPAPPVCQPQADWCTLRCGKTTDNCANPVDCGACKSGSVCKQNTCACEPQAVAATCGAMQCGQATNNCGQLVNCGVGGSAACPGAQICMAGTCCSPDNAAACANACGVTVTNNCGQMVACPSVCAGAKVCVQSKCCVPGANGCNVCAPDGSCSGKCTDNCGMQDPKCCKGGGGN